MKKKIFLIALLALYFGATELVKIKIERNYQETLKQLDKDFAEEVVIAKSETTEITEEIIEEKENLKCANGKAKTYMSYKMITAKNSNQYKYIKEYMSVNEKGFLVDKDNRIGVAMGSYFGAIGSKYDIELENGNVLRVVKVEAKDDKHTNNGCEQKWDKSVIEFVIDTKVAKEYYGVASNGFINQGNYNNVDEFNGNIEVINKID